MVMTDDTVVPKKPPVYYGCSPFGVLAALILLLVTVGGLVKWKTQPAESPDSAIRLTRSLPAYSFLTAEDVSGTVTPTNRIHVTTTQLEKGSTLTATAYYSLSSDEQWRIASIPVSTTLAFTAGDPVVLLGLSSDDGDDRNNHQDIADDVVVVSNKAIALGVASGQLIVALPRADAWTTAPYLLPGRQVLVVRRPEPTNTPSSSPSPTPEGTGDDTN